MFGTFGVRSAARQRELEEVCLELDRWAGLMALGLVGQGTVAKCYSRYRRNMSRF